MLAAIVEKGKKRRRGEFAPHGAIGRNKVAGGTRLSMKPEVAEEGEAMI